MELFFNIRSFLLVASAILLNSDGPEDVDIDRLTPMLDPKLLSSPPPKPLIDPPEVPNPVRELSEPNIKDLLFTVTVEEVGRIRFNVLSDPPADADTDC